jgi:uncharacterized membrane protein YphA (DoxX/SURF4 family)
MNKYLSTLGRVLLAQIFLLQVIALIVGFFNNPTGYLDYQNALGHQGLPGVFAPLIILVQLVGGSSLLLGYKTKTAAIEKLLQFKLFNKVLMKLTRRLRRIFFNSGIEQEVSH